MSRSTRGREFERPMLLLVLALAFRLILERLLPNPKLEGMKGEKTDDRGEGTGLSMGSAGTLAMGANGGPRGGPGGIGGLTTGPGSPNWPWFWMVLMVFLLRAATFRRSRRIKKAPRMRMTTTMTDDVTAIAMIADLQTDQPQMRNRR